MILYQDQKPIAGQDNHWDLFLHSAALQNKARLFQELMILLPGSEAHSKPARQEQLMMLLPGSKDHNRPTKGNPDPKDNPDQRKNLSELKPGLANNHMEQSSRDSVLTVAAVLSFFTARSVRLDNESSKLLLLTPHNDTVYDLQDALGLPASNYPPTLYDFYLTILYKQNFLATNAENLKLFNRPDHTGTREITPSLHEVTPMEIYWHIQKHSDVLTPQLEAFATLKAIVEIVHSCPIRASRLTAPSPTLSRLLELEVLPPSLSLLRCLASLPTPRKPKPATWLHSPAARACASSYFPQRTCTLPARSIPYELYVLSVMACFTLVRTG